MCWIASAKAEDWNAGAWLRVREVCVAETSGHCGRFGAEDVYVLSVACWIGAGVLVTMSRGLMERVWSERRRRLWTDEEESMVVVLWRCSLEAKCECLAG